MEKFAAGSTRLYSGSASEKEKKQELKATPDYAQWRIVSWENSWCNRRKKNNIWHGLTIFLKNGTSIGHIVIGDGELAYFLSEEYWNKGYGSEAAAALVRIAVPYIMINFSGIITGQNLTPSTTND